ncbi:hypothetical protein MPRS_39910 [Mycobacterium paraseoulense]|nr:hypothetical protein MPRS_39910 [Mycobacterium paraseoulense]
MVSASECTDSASMAELPVTKKPTNFATAIPAFAANATTTDFVVPSAAIA